MAKNKDLFLDYGKLIFDHRFDNETLARAHQFAAEVISSRGHTIDPTRIAKAHQEVINLIWLQEELINEGLLKKRFLFKK